MDNVKCMEIFPRTLPTKGRLSYLEDVPQGQKHLLWVDGRQYKYKCCHIHASLGDAGCQVVFRQVTLKGLAAFLMVHRVFLRKIWLMYNKGKQQEV